MRSSPACRTTLRNGAQQLYARFDSATGADTVDNTYDGFGRLSSQTTAMYGVSRTVGYLYDADGNRIRITHPDTVYFTTDYDGLDRAITVKENGSTAIATMAYDAQGREMSETRGPVATSFGYDGVSRLSSLTDDLPGGITNDLTTTLSYSPASQIISRIRSNPTPYAFGGYVNVSRAYVANGLNQYATVAGAMLGYDSNGNLVSDGTTSYGYDAENRLVTTTFGAGYTFAYDPLGRLYGIPGSASKSSVYDGDQRIVDYTADPAVIQYRYVMGPGTDNPLLWYAGSTLSDRRALQADERGSIVSVVDAAGALYGINTYDEYGIPGSANAGRYGYTGQVWISSVGMWYYKARFYSPTLGRFMQTDPIGYADQNNLYAYVGNDPMDASDPTGLEENVAGAAKFGVCTGSIACTGSFSPGSIGIGTRGPSSNDGIANAARRGGKGKGASPGTGERGRTATADGSPDPDKHRYPGTDAGTRKWKDSNGTTKTGPWSEDPRTGGDGTGVRRGSKYPGGTKVPQPSPTSGEEMSRAPAESRWNWLPSGRQVLGGVLVLGTGVLIIACAVAEPCGGIAVGAGAAAGATRLATQ